VLNEEVKAKQQIIQGEAVKFSAVNARVASLQSEIFAVRKHNANLEDAMEALTKDLGFQRSKTKTLEAGLAQEKDKNNRASFQLTEAGDMARRLHQQLLNVERQTPFERDALRQFRERLVANEKGKAFTYRLLDFETTVHPYRARNERCEWQQPGCTLSLLRMTKEVVGLFGEITLPKLVSFLKDSGVAVPSANTDKIKKRVKDALQRLRSAKEIFYSDGLWKFGFPPDQPDAGGDAGHKRTSTMKMM